MQLSMSKLLRQKLSPRQALAGLAHSGWQQKKLRGCRVAGLLPCRQMVALGRRGSRGMPAGLGSRQTLSSLVGTVQL